MRMSVTESGAVDQPIPLRSPEQPVERRAIGWWVLQAVALLVPLLGGLLTAYALILPARPWLVPAIVITTLACPVLLVVEPWWRYRVHRWEITDEAVYAVTGWLIREWRIAPISRIQTVDTVRGPLQQLLGLATLRVTTASARGAIDIVGLDDQVAADAARRLGRITQATHGDAT